jgi:hypothetical protein
MVVTLMLGRQFAPSIWEWAIFQRPPLLSTYKRRLPSPHFNNTQVKSTKEKEKSNTTPWA